jgi:hypothetical protein
MKRRLMVKRLHSRDREDNTDEYNDNPEACLDIVEKLRREAENFVYGNAATFQRTVTVVRKEQG